MLIRNRIMSSAFLSLLALCQAGYLPAAADNGAGASAGAAARTGAQAGSGASAGAGAAARTGAQAGSGASAGAGAAARTGAQAGSGASAGAGAAAGAPGEYADDQTGRKAIVLPTKASKEAPSLSWLPREAKPRLAILCLHGFSLHKGCFDAFGKEMANRGIAVYAIDLRGFGESKRIAERTELDFDGCLVDIKATLEQIRREQPGIPVVLLGESMGGAMALRATALYPDLVEGLISSVPARDRFGLTGGEALVGIKAGLSTIFGGYRKPIKDVALTAVAKISDKEEVRKQWTDDPLMRTSFSPKEFVQLDHFMSDNLEAASMVKDKPVLFIQGTNDKLIRPAGTWKLFERLSTANRQMVLSKNSEHLIFEEGQFKPDDINFVVTWIDRNVVPLGSQIASARNKLPVVASLQAYSDTKIGDDGTTGSAASPKIAIVPKIPPAPPKKEFEHRIATKSAPQINYWIELHRDGKTYRCNNKMEFRSGDSIRFHLIPETDGYAYLVMRKGTTGKSDVLFPNAAYGTQNFLKKGQDYAVPADGWMQFDNNPGTEQLGLVFGTDKLDVTPDSLKNRTLTCFVSPEQSGAKDLCPTRMKLSWDDPTPTIIPDDFQAVSQLANAEDSSLVRLQSTIGQAMIAASIELQHGN